MLGVAAAVNGFAAPSLRLSGTLAQNAENGTGFRTLDSAGITNDPATGNLLILNGGNLYEQGKDGSRKMILKLFRKEETHQLFHCIQGDAFTPHAQQFRRLHGNVATGLRSRR